MTESENPKSGTEAQNEFAFSLFDKLHKSNLETPNKLISPLSIYMDFGMLYNGASGETKKAIQKGLQMNTGNAEFMNKTQAKILTDFPQIDSSVTINMANAIWYRNGLTPKKTFLDTNKKYYNARIEGADFKNPQTVKDINQWVMESTQGKITSIMDGIAPSEIMFLLNAVYFKGDWQEAFQTKFTRDHAFYTPTGTKELPLMFMDHRFNYLENDDLQMAELPYGDGHFNMQVLLPSKNSNVDELIAKLNTGYYDSLLDEMTSMKIKLFLPKWEIEYSVDNLKDQLSEMGMGLAFESKADFSELFEDDYAKVSQVKHKTYIKVDEKGTEAAAVTSIGMVTTSMPMPTETEMKVDRPFVYLITERNSGTILFLGVVKDPS